MFELLANVLNELERLVFSIDENKPRRDNEALVAKFFEIFRNLAEILPDKYEDAKRFTTFFDELDLLECYESFFVDWDSERRSFVVRGDKGRRVEFLRNWLQSLIWGLLGKALKYMPTGEEALGQAYEDILNGFEGYRDTDALELLHQLGLEKAKAYRDFMSVKEKYKSQIRSLETLYGLRQILSLVNKEWFSYKTRVIINDWWSKILMFSQLDTALSDKLDSLGIKLVSLDILITLERLHRKKGVESVRSLLSINDSVPNCPACIEAWVRTRVLSSLFGERGVQLLKTSPQLAHSLRRQLESCIAQRLYTLKNYIEKRLESCIKTERKSITKVKKVKVSDPPFIVLYHTFFLPIIWKGRKSSYKEVAGAEDVSFEEMLKEIEAFKPDRCRDFPLWWAKEKFKEKISQNNQDKKEKLVRLFYKLIKGEISIDTYHKELNSYSFELL